MDDTVWEPDESVFGTLNHSDIQTLEEKVVNNSSSDKNEQCIVSSRNYRNVRDSEFVGNSDTLDWDNKSSADLNNTIEETNNVIQKTIISGLDEFRRKSVEDFLEMDSAILETVPRNKHCKRVSRHRNIKRSQRTKMRLPNNDEIASELTVPLPPTSASTFTERPSSSVSSKNNLQNEANKTLLDMDSQYRRLPFEGSMDYWEQYDPDFVRKWGVAVITSNENELPVCVEALCFLCGSAGKQNTILCTNN